MGEYEGWQGGWVTWYTNLMIEQDEPSNRRAGLLAKKAIERGLDSDTVALAFAKNFKRQRNFVKKEFDEDLRDTIAERGEFESRQIEGQKPTGTGNKNKDILNEVMDLIRSDMGSGSLPEWQDWSA